MTQLQKPQHLISLASSSVLVGVDINVWSATKQDKVVSDEVTTAKRADKSAGKFVKNLLADHHLHKSIVNYRQTIYNWVQRRTYDWAGSQRLLPAVDLPKFCAEFRDHETAFHDLVEKLIASYDDIVSDMAFKQGDMFDRSEYPNKETLRTKFGLAMYVLDVPMQDFRCQIAQEIAEDLFNTYSKQTDAIIQKVMQDQAERFVSVMTSISHCCGMDEKDGKTKKRKIYDSTIEKAKEMCETFAGFNLAANQDLEEARVSLERTLNGVSAEMIRESDAVREQVKEGVDEILSKFAPLSVS
jgi:hypothetical protein